MLHSKNFKFNKISLAVLMTLAGTSSVQTVFAASGWGEGTTINSTATSAPESVQTYYANSPLGTRPNVNPAAVSGVDANGVKVYSPATVDTGKAIRKFVDQLPVFGEAGAPTIDGVAKYIPKAIKDVTTYPDADYYELAIVEYKEKMHSDLFKATRLRGYVQLSTAVVPGKQIPLTYPDGTPIMINGAQALAVDNPHYFGPLIEADSGRPVRIKYSNLLPIGAAGEMFLPVDETLPGSGFGPDGQNKYLQNRADIHFHGGDTPWISDGTPHQWIAPAGETSAYAVGMGKGASSQNVPDMADPGNGSTTLYFPNNQTARMMWYHDHTLGMTRLNVYAGMAAPYILHDPKEADLVARGVIPADSIPLIIQDKTFVPKDIGQQDAKWNTTHWGTEGDLWYPHVYETNQDPNSLDATNPVGRWDWGPWFWPVFPAQYSLPSGEYGDVTTTPEAFMDTAVVNGVAYPTMTVEPKAYRFRILNATNDRFVNLGLYKADMTVVPGTVDAAGNPITGTEVKMVPAAPNPAYPATWPTDGRAGGAPDPASAGPDIIQIGNEGGLLPHPVTIPSQPTTYEQNRRSITVLNVLDQGLMMGPAMRADVIVDFSAYAGQTLILYNDAPAPMPAFDPRIDYFTGDGDQSTAGGATDTLPGYGPNTRTLVQIKVAAAVTTAPAVPFNKAVLETEIPEAYGLTQSPPVIPESAYNQAFGTNDKDNYFKIFTGTSAQPTYTWTPSTAAVQNITAVTLVGTGTGYLTVPTVVFTGGVDLTVAGNRAATAIATVDQDVVDPLTLKVIKKGTRKITSIVMTDPGFGYKSAPNITFVGGSGIGATAVVSTSATQSLPIQNKSIIELFEPIFGRMNATLGVELPFTSALNQTAIPLAYIDPATESIGVGETQIWKITHNGVDSHPVHFHLVNMQILNRIGWDGTVKPPLGNELGWKETVQMNPLEDIIVAVRAKKPMTPFGLPQSVRMLDPTQPVDATLGFTQVNIANNTPLTVKNRLENYDNEYVWHCHILGHEENDFMRPFVFHPNDATPNAPGNVVVSNGALTWTDPTPVGAPGTLGNAQNEIGFRVERTEGVASATSVWARAGNALANATSFTDAGAIAGTNYSYRVFAYNSKGDSLPSSEANLTAVPLAPTEFFAVANALGMPTLVSMTWTDNAINETGYQVLRNGAVIANLPANNSAVPTTMTYSDSTALPSTLYTYTVQAVNGAGVSPAIAPVSVTTPVSVVANPGALAAVVTPIGVSPMTVSLSWANLAAATSYQLTRNGTVVANLSPGATNFIDASVAETTTYTYVLTAFNTAGATALPAVTVTTPIGLPLAPTSFVATANALGQPTQVSLTWVDNATNETAYEIFRNAVLLTNLPAGSSSYIDTTALPVRTYSYQVVAIDPAGRGASATLTVRTPVGLAAAATGLTAKATAVGVFPMAVTLNWTDNANNETSYQVIRNGILITTLGANVTTYLDQAVAGSTAYTYVITAVNTAAAVPSAPVSVTTPVGLPLAPTLLRATSTAIPQQVNLTWVDNATNETSYQVLRNNILIATLPAGSTSYSDTTVTELTTYTYQVVAVDPAGTASSGLVQVTTVSAVLAPTNLTITESTGLQATLRWTDNATNETRYRILRAPVVAGVVGTYAQIGNIAANSTTYVDPTVLVIGNDYSYQVIAVRTAPVTNVVTLSAPATATINIALLVPVAPSALTATPNSAARVTLNWADNANNETSYKVERAVVTGGVIGTYAVLNAALPLNTRTFVDNSAAAGNIYSYRVSAGNAAGSSPAALVTANMTAYAVAPTNLTAVASATRRATLTWADNATNETGYRVERALVTGTTVGAYATVANLAVNVTTYADPTALLALRTYSYRVTAVTAVAANNSASVTVSVTMP